MAIKPIESYDEEYIEEGFSAGVMIKTGFLLVVLVFGAFFWWYSYSYSEEISQRMAMANVKQRPTLNPDLPVKSPTPPFFPKTASKQTVQAGDTGNTTVANKQLAAPETELVQESSQLLTQVQSGGGELFESSWQQVASVGGSVLGIAAEQVKNTASSSAQMVTDSLYQNTIGQVILQLFNTLPNQAKKDVAEDICDETEECTVR